MVNGLIKMAEKAKSVLFADPKLLYREERHLINEPFFFEGQNGKGVLLIHGWTSTPYEVRRLGKFLNENGYTVSGILLTGHGTFPEDLENVKWEIWMDDVKAGYEKLRESCEKVYVAGTSIGGNIALEFAKENSEISAIVLMATPYKMKFEKIGLFLAKLAVLLGKKYSRKFYPPTFGLSSTITRIISYQKYSIKSALETYSLIKESRKNLDKITQPCFILQSTHDHMIKKSSAQDLYEKIGSKIKKKAYIQKAYHTFISDIKNEHIFEDILRFIEEN